MPVTDGYYQRREGGPWYRIGDASTHNYRPGNCERCGRECMLTARQRFCGSACAGLRDSAGISALHYRVYKARGRADHCIFGCEHSRYEWANLTGNYDDVNDFAQMCKQCHQSYDGAIRMMAKDTTGINGWRPWYVRPENRRITDK
jgi:hypothetical protein